MAENEAQRLHCRMLPTGVQAVAENEAQRLRCRMLQTGKQAM